MRILRSQYLSERSSLNSIIGQKVPCKTNKNSYNGSKFTSYTEYSDINNNDGFASLTQTSTTTTTTTKVRRKSLMLTNNEGRYLFSTATHDSCIDDLYGFPGFPETSTVVEPASFTPAPIRRRRQTMAICTNNTSYQQSHTMQIKFSNVPEKVRKINVTVQFTDMGPLWLTRIYQSYENDLWQKRPRPWDNKKTQLILKSGLAKKRWFFDCLLCFRPYCSYTSLKGHLNHHLEIYPYGCKLCTMQYTTRNSITKHLKSKHNLEREEFNDYIGS